MDVASKRLEQCNFKLTTLLHITQAITQSLTVTDLLDRYKHILVNDLGIGSIIFFKKKDKGWDCIFSYSQDDAQKNRCEDIQIEKDLSSFTDISYITHSPNPVFKGYDIIIPIIQKNNPIAYVLIGDIKEERKGVSPTIKHLSYIQTLTNIMIVALENLRLFDETIHQAALRREMELASNMQNMLIPDPATLPKNEYVHVKSFYHPHYDIGGDYYDFIELDDNLIGFCVADVSGKGISAALLMSNFQANIRAILDEKISLADFAGILNSRVVANTKGDRFITLFLARYNYDTRELEYINAGHNPPILYEIQDKRITYLNKGCAGMGMLEEIPIIKRGVIKITQHSKLLCFTDGIVELIGENGEQLGNEALEKELCNELGIDLTLDNIIKKNNVLNEKGNTSDDITLLGVEFF